MVSAFSCALQMLATSTVTMSLPCLTRSSLHSQGFDPLQLYFYASKSTKLAKYIVFQWHRCTKFVVLITWKTAQMLLESWSSGEGRWILIRKKGGATTFRAHYMCTEMQNESDGHKKGMCHLPRMWTSVHACSGRPEQAKWYARTGGAFVSLIFLSVTRCLWCLLMTFSI